MKKIRVLLLSLFAILTFNACQKENIESDEATIDFPFLNYDKCDSCNTAFAKGNYVFATNKKANPEQLPSLKLSRNRWGWAININEIGTTYYKIWACAGLNDISKGKIVAYLKVENTGTQVVVTYVLVEGYVLDEAHVYAGDKKPCTTAPGRYGNTFFGNDEDRIFSYTIPVKDTNGDGIWLIAHAVICLS